MIGVLLSLAIPFLPVEQQQSSMSWPQDGRTFNVDAPLVSYAPTQLDVEVPDAAVRKVAAGGGGTVVATAPDGAIDRMRYGLVAVVSQDRDIDSGTAQVLEITLRDRLLWSAALDPEVDSGFAITSSSISTQVTIGDDVTTYEGDMRPQVVGVYSDLDGLAPPGMTVSVEIDSRFSSSPSMVKFVAMVIAVLATALALVALNRIDRHRGKQLAPSRWTKMTPLDVVVVTILVLWHFIGATTSDDGYQFTMARTSGAAGYMANYFRWYGVPEAPFGTPYYDLLALMTHVSTASPWIRLPALIAGVIAWALISREVAPRLGRAVSGDRVVLWTGALMFLAFWLPYNNGLRPEPIVTVGVLSTWCLVERAIATRVTFYAAAAVLVAASTVTVGPSGIIVVGVLLTGIRPVLRHVAVRARQLNGSRRSILGYAAMLGPVFAAGMVVLVAVFADQTLAAVREMQSVHGIGPSMAWFEESNRYQWLFGINADGSLARRFGVLMMLLSVAIVVAVMLRRGGKVPGTAAGPSRRLVTTVVAAVILMMFTPTKWTHHFGVFAALAGALALLAAAACSSSVIRSSRNRTLLSAAVLFVLAVCFTSSNSWWYVSSYGIPWWDKPVQLAEMGAGTILLGLTALLLLVAGVKFLKELRTDSGGGRLRSLSPLMGVAAAMVAVMVLSFLKGAVAQYPAFSLAKSNFSALAGRSCGLAAGVLVETDPNASMLQPVDGDIAAGLSTVSSGFDPNGVADDLQASEEGASEGITSSIEGDRDDRQMSNTAGTGGGTGAVGINGSSVAMPFGLDPTTTPVMGSYGADRLEFLESHWYAIPSERTELLSVTVAGHVRSVDSDGVETPGVRLEFEYGSRGPDGDITTLGRALPVDIGPAPSWRNLRVPMNEVPTQANTVRLVVDDAGSQQNHWVAVTPPRMPRTRSMVDFLGYETPVMIDWSVGLQFPCQRPFTHHLGVSEIPEYRILPDRPATVMTTLWQDHHGGGPLGWLELSTTSRTIPTYLRDDWDRDWGSLEHYDRRDSGAVPANLDLHTVRRSGTWSPGPINTSW
uniref:arabinosyltransferase domain-containing protein n=1 Tax=Rhodococcus qingshengii TaxID=334542 RepID=UPI001C4E1C5F